MNNSSSEFDCRPGLHSRFVRMGITLRGVFKPVSTSIQIVKERNGSAVPQLGSIYHASGKIQHRKKNFPFLFEMSRGLKVAPSVLCRREMAFVRHSPQ